MTFLLLFPNYVSMKNSKILLLSLKINTKNFYVSCKRPEIEWLNNWQNLSNSGRKSRSLLRTVRRWNNDMSSSKLTLIML